MNRRAVGDITEAAFVRGDTFINGVQVSAVGKSNVNVCIFKPESRIDV